MLIKKPKPESVLMKNRYLILFLVLLTNLSLPGFFTTTTFSEFISPIMTLLIFGSGMLLVQKMAKTAQWVVILGVIGVLGVIFNVFDGYLYMAGLFIFSIFIGIVTIELFDDLIKKKSIELPEIFGALSGYILIGYIGALLFILINVYFDNAFGNVNGGREGTQDLVYFSYITMLTIGYGEIVPLIPPSRNVAIVLGLVGQFYMVVVIATFVGKFLQNSSSEEKSKPS